MIVTPGRSSDLAPLIAKVDKIKIDLGWEPKFDSLDLIRQASLSWKGRF